MSQIEKEAQELAEYVKNADIQIDIDKMEAIIGPKSWKVNPEGHTARIRDQLVEVAKKYEKESKELIEKGTSELDVQLFVEKGSKDMLKLSLLGFDYDKEVNDADVGPVALKMLADELFAFLVVQGGKVGFKHWQMRQRLAMLSSSNTSKD